jgi:hypothetical protein
MRQRRRVEIVSLSTWGTGVLIGVRYRGARALSSQRAVSMIMGMSRLSLRARGPSHISSPDKPGNIQSSMTRSGGVSERRGSGSSPRSTCSASHAASRGEQACHER